MLSSTKETRTCCSAEHAGEAKAEGKRRVAREADSAQTGNAAPKRRRLNTATALSSAVTSAHLGIPTSCFEEGLKLCQTLCWLTAADCLTDEITEFCS